MSEETAPIERPFQSRVSGENDASANLGSEPVRRRGPGRPRKDGSSAPVSPVAQAVPANSAQPKGKPGRKPKKRAVTDEQKTIMGKQIAGLHMVASLAFGIPELVITPQEGDLLAGALAAVADEYGLALDGKTGAAIQLIGTGAMIYLPRYFAMQKRIKQTQLSSVETPPAPDAINGAPTATVN